MPWIIIRMFLTPLSLVNLACIVLVKKSLFIDKLLAWTIQLNGTLCHPLIDIFLLRFCYYDESTCMLNESSQSYFPGFQRYVFGISNGTCHILKLPALEFQRWIGSDCSHYWPFRPGVGEMLDILEVLELSGVSEAVFLFLEAEIDGRREFGSCVWGKVELGYQ